MRPRRLRVYADTSVFGGCLDDECAKSSLAFFDAGIVGFASSDDAEHVASASLAQVDIIVSWNFRHIVQYEKINRNNGVKLLHGYGEVRIHAPREVVDA